jgi:hypothetical protein
VLLVGVEDSTGSLLAAGLDAEWLRHRIYERVDIAPLVEERMVDGVRLLVVFVAESREPIEDSHGKLRWRVGGTASRSIVPSGGCVVRTVPARTRWRLPPNVPCSTSHRARLRSLAEICGTQWMATTRARLVGRILNFCGGLACFFDLTDD